MKILCLYPNNDGYFRCPVGLTLIMTILKKEGHEVKLFDTTFMAAEDNNDDVVRQKSGSVKSPPISTTHLYEKYSDERIIAIWLETIQNFKPDVIAASILEDAYEFCGTLLDSAKKNFDIPVVAGGVTPTLSPYIVIEHPSIDMVIQGEGEVAFKELCIALKNKSSLSEVPNLWYKKNGEIKKNKLVRYMDINKLPNQTLDFWNKNHFLKPFDGKMYKAGFFEMSRGCMHKCHYCFNRYMQIGLDPNEVGKYRRNKTVDTIIREVLELNKKMNYGLILFTDDNFLGRSFAEMDEFYERWAKEVKIPYWHNTCIETLNERNLPQLKKSGCIGISIGMETGSEWIRRNVLLKGNMPNKMYYEGFKMMAETGIRSTLNVMIGFPGEYEEDHFETVKLSKSIRSIDKNLTSHSIAFVAPYAGTVIHNICLDLGLMDTDYKPGYRGLCKGITVMKEPVINNPCMTKERTIELYYNFADYINGKKEIPKKFLETDSERHFAKNDLKNIEIYKLYAEYKNGPRDINPTNVVERKNYIKHTKDNIGLFSSSPK